MPTGKGRVPPTFITPVAEDESPENDLPLPHEHKKIRRRLGDALRQNPVVNQVYNATRKARNMQGSEPIGAADRTRALELIVIALAERNEELRETIAEIDKCTCPDPDDHA